MKRLTATAAVLLSGVAANSAHAIDPLFAGSDTLEPIIENFQIIYDIAAIDPDWEYDAQGSGSGENAVMEDNQEFGPMSRFLDPDPGDGCDAPNADPDYAGCWSIARDSITIYGNPATACTDQGLLFDGVIAGVQFDSFDDVLRVIYAGDDGAIGNPDCDSNVRRTLVSEWTNLFQGECNAVDCPDGLKHAYRRDDNSGTTGVFLELLGLPSLANTPFCNGNEFQDADPIRVDCSGVDGTETGFGGDGIQVCGTGATPAARAAGEPLGDGTLGLVVPVVIPSNAYGDAPIDDNPAMQFVDANCGVGSFGGGGFAPVRWGFAQSLAFGSACPNGSPTAAGTCLFPIRFGQAGNPLAMGCVAARNDRPLGSPTDFDARVYNAFNVVAGEDPVTGNTIPVFGTIIRNEAPRPANPVFNGAHQLGCRENDATGSIACFVEQEQCSIGFGGFDGTSRFAVEGIELADGNGGTAPPTDVANYPFSRSLYLCQVDEFGSSTGTQSQPYLDVQQTIWDDVLNGDPNGRIELAVTGGQSANGPVPATAYFPLAAGPEKTCCQGVYNPATNLCE